MLGIKCGVSSVVVVHIIYPLLNYHVIIIKLCVQLCVKVCEIRVFNWEEARQVQYSSRALLTFVWRIQGDCAIRCDTVADMRWSNSWYLFVT
jgi:hypothetical protein